MIDPSSLRSKMPAGFYPFWFWNDRLDADEVRWQVREMAAKGIKGFYIHPRQGLGQPYLSDAFMKMVFAALQEAEAHGLTVHLYDEYPYPTGPAGGEAILGSPQYRATELVQREYEVDGGPVELELPRGAVLAVRAYPLQAGQVNWSGRVDLRTAVGNLLVNHSYLETGLTAYNQKRYFTSDPVPVLETRLPEGKWRIYAAVQAEVAHNKYWGHFLDVLNPEAVQAFLRLTDERYARYFGSAFGDRILSIFTDETYPGWSALLPEKFQAVCGYDLLDCLEALRDAAYPDALRVRVDHRRVVYDLFVEAFERPLSQKRQELGLAYCGEKPVMRLAQMRFMDIPGCEPGHTKAGAPLDLLQHTPRGNARATASAAYFYGKAGALDECYHSLGWSGTLQDAKWMVDGQLLLGIRYLVPHGFFYSTHSLRKHDAPPTFFFQAPYWPLFGLLSRYVDRITQHFEDTHIAAEVLLVEPAWGMPTRPDFEAYLRLQNWLMAHQFDFLHVDTDILLESRVEKGMVFARDLAARVVIVPPMQAVEEDLGRWLADFEQQGGKVIRCGADFDPAALETALASRVVPGIRLKARQGDAGKVWAVRRVFEGKTLWFLMNTSGESLDLELDAGVPLREISLQEGRTPALCRDEETYSRTVAPFESFLLVDGLPEDAPQSAAVLPHVKARLAGPAEVILDRPNLLRMAEWKMALVDENGQAGETARVEPMPIANQLADSRLPFTPRFVQRFGLMPGLEMPELHVRYTFVFENAYAGPVDLVMEPGSLGGDWQIWVNDHGPLGPADFRQSQAHVRGSLGASVTGWLRPGANQIRLEVQTNRLDGGLLNPLYLAGDFGVVFQPTRLVERPAAGVFEDYLANRLPYYSGVLEYQMALDLPALPDGPRMVVDLETPGVNNEAMEISINGSEFVPVVWQPRCVELPASLLHSGTNQAVVRVYTTLIRAFEGTWFDEDRHCYQPVA